MQQKNTVGTRYAAVFTSLFRIYAALVFGVSRWQNLLCKRSSQARRSSADEPRTDSAAETAANRRRVQSHTGAHSPEGAGSDTSIVKTALFILFLIYIGGSFIMLFRMLAVNLYKSLQPLGMQQLLFEIEAAALFVFLFISNFLLTLSTYFIGSIEHTLRAMPIPARIFFGAKYLAHCVPAAVLSCCFFGITAAVYGSYEHSAVSFYVMAVTGAVFFPLPVIGLCYLITIGVMRATNILKNRRFVMLITGTLGIAMALGMNYFVQSVTILRGIANAADTIERYRTGTFALMQYLLPVRFFADALAAGSFSAGYRSFIPFIAVCIAVPAAVIGLLSGMYEKTLDGFDEQPVKRLAKSETLQFIRSRFMRRSAFTALLRREIRMMNREPAYLLNGPFTMLLLPLIYGMMYLSGSLRLPPETAELMQGNAGIVIAGAVGAFIGSTSGVAATAVSRDAKNLRLIKSLPLSMKRFMQAKLAHAMLFAGTGACIGVGGSAFLFSLTPLHAAGSLMIALSLALFCNLLALMLDTVHPKLHWDTPTAAVKHNLNTVIMFFFDIALVSITGTAAVLIPLPPTQQLLCAAGIPLLASGVIAHFFWPYADRQISRIEI